MKFAHKREEFIAIDRSLDIKVETILELTFRNLTALELHKVYTCGIEARHNAEKCSRTVRYVYHYTCTVGT